MIASDNKFGVVVCKIKPFELLLRTLFVFKFSHSLFITNTFERLYRGNLSLGNANKNLTYAHDEPRRHIIRRHFYTAFY